MTHRWRELITAGAVAALAFGCGPDADTELERPGNGPPSQAERPDAGSQSETGGCEPVPGTDLTAKSFNEDVIGETLDIGDCDVGAYFDEDGVVDSARILQPDADTGPSEQYGVLVEGAAVYIEDSEFDVTDDYRDQFIQIGYRDGARGFVGGNHLTGFKRVGILLDGQDTRGEIRDNTLEGVGPKTAGWAENGIQISKDARGVVRNNVVEDHWYNTGDWCSSGILVFESDNVNIQRNSVMNNDCGIGLQGDRNKALHNDVQIDLVEDAVPEAAGIGISVWGQNNGVIHNDIAGDVDVPVGIWVQDNSHNTKLIGNDIEGFFEAIFDMGESTKLPRPFEPER